MKIRLRELSLKWKIFSFLLGFCGLLICILWLFQIVFLNSFYRAIKTGEIKSYASQIEKNIDSDDFSALINRIASEGNLAVFIVDDNGEIITSCGNPGLLPPGQMAVFDLLGIIQAAETNNGTYIQFYDQDIHNGFWENGFRGQKNRQKSTMLFMAKNITNSDGENLTVILNSPIVPVQSTVDTLRTQLYIITAIMLVFSAVLALIISKKVATPIEDINHAAKKLAKGNYMAAFDGKGYKEITELSQTLNATAKELSQVEQLRQELIANISHDLRTPLTLIGGYADMMCDLPGENTPENAKIIADETKRLTTLVNDVLDLSKLQSGAMTLDKQEYNLTKSIEETILRVGELVKTQGFTIDFEYQNQVMVCADQSKISQCVYNLLINAINYTGDDKKVVVRQITNGNKVRIQFEDTGEGISPQNLPHIWDRYYKAGTNHKRAVTGSGIGLSIVKSIIQLHKGSYGVNSEPSRGSQFWFEINFFKYLPV